MRRITIEIPEPGDPDHMRCGFDVVDEAGRRCDGLAWDEMLGQVATLTHPRLDGTAHYRMRTPDEWTAERAERLAATSDDSVVDASFQPPQGA